MTVKLPIYLDYQATTPVDPRVFEAMKPYFCERFGNAASRTHSFGWVAEAAVNKAREQVASLIHASPQEIIWTSGATESINLALTGIASSYKEKGNHIITAATEHNAVLDTCHFLQKQGYLITILPVDNQGHIDLDQLQKEIRKETILITLMAVNNEIGLIHPLKEIGRLARSTQVLFHVDAAQACGKIPLDVQAMGIDLLSMSAHKVYGPKGTGALFARGQDPKVKLIPLLHGGGHEKGFRSGTLAVPNIVGMGEAFGVAGRERATEAKRILGLRHRLWEGLVQSLKGVQLNGPSDNRLPENLNLSFEGIRADALMGALPDLALSSGAACTSAKAEPSHVLKALGLSKERVEGSIRLGLGRFTTLEEIDDAIRKMTEAVTKLRKNRG